MSNLGVTRKGKTNASADSVILNRAVAAVNAAHLAGIEMEPKGDFIRAIHIRPKGSRQSLCGLTVHPANSEQYRQVDATCQECQAAYSDLVERRRAEESKNYWANPNAGAAIAAPAQSAPPRKRATVVYEQPGLFAEMPVERVEIKAY